ncbi:MAG: ABC transporter permease [Coleofasciculaceae cyanobacterium SM2_1_6]|nr:ABC transporter permease [Coleofasciculaceae cyanobacterium SM2_1_6]
MSIILGGAYTYLVKNSSAFTTALGQHLLLVIIPLGVSLLLALPLGWWSSRSSIAANIFLNGFNSLRVIPSIAVLFLAIPYLGLNFSAAAIALTLLTIPPILINTNVGFRAINPQIKEAAIGMGMTPTQVLWRVEVPLALPVIIAGIKTATVEVISSATLAAFIGAGGLGRFIVLGFALYDNSILLVGAIPVACLALIAEVGLGFLQNKLEVPAQKKT